jgi:hypothetical protein
MKESMNTYLAEKKTKFFIIILISKFTTYLFIYKLSSFFNTKTFALCIGKYSSKCFVKFGEIKFLLKFLFIKLVSVYLFFSTKSKLLTCL